MFGSTFYFGIMKKLVVAFGTIFNDISLVRTDAAGHPGRAPRPGARDGVPGRRLPGARCRGVRRDRPGGRLGGRRPAGHQEAPSGLTSRPPAP